MTVKTLRLRNFRNYRELSVDFSEKLNILYGENAQGKTNILEAIFLCSTGRSHRTQKDVEMIRFGENSAVVSIELERKDYGIFNIEIEIKRSGRKGILVNGVPQRRAGDLLGRLNCAMFSPEDLGIIKDEPQIRRRFLDMFISQIKPAYYFNLQRYLGALRQRNALLKQVKENPGLLESIGAWDSQLSEFGAKVMWERLFFIERITKNAGENYSRIAGGRENMHVAYEPSVKIFGGGLSDSAGSPVFDANGSVHEKERREAEDYMRNIFAGVLERGLHVDIMRQTTQFGPHKDDVSCSIDGKTLRLFGSQGQQRTAALALKMAQIDVMSYETGDIPVLLLDDVMSELDRGRRENLSVSMNETQTFITGTERYDPAGAVEDSSCFRIHSGEVTKD
jgi:DNA replication and repair protein RecF